MMSQFKPDLVDAWTRLVDVRFPLGRMIRIPFHVGDAEEHHGTEAAHSRGGTLPRNRCACFMWNHLNPLEGSRFHTIRAPPPSRGG